MTLCNDILNIIKGNKR